MYLLKSILSFYPPMKEISGDLNLYFTSLAAYLTPSLQFLAQQRSRIWE